MKTDNEVIKYVDETYPECSPESRLKICMQVFANELESDLLRKYETWPLIDIMNKLLYATDFLLNERNYDLIGWEDISHCLKLGKEYVKKITPCK